MKRFFFWALVASLTLVLIGVIWFFFFNTNGSMPTYLGGGDLPGSPNRLINKKPNSGGATSTENGSPIYISPLQKIWDKPVAGFSFEVVPIIISSTSTNAKGEEVISQERATTTYLFFVEKSTGNVYKKDFSTNRIIRVTNTTIPAVQEALFLRGGQVVVIQTYNKDTRKMEVLVADVPRTVSEDSPASLGSPVLLQDNIFSFASSYDGTSLYYLVPNQKGSTLYRYTKEKGSVFVESLPLKDITLSITNKDVYVVSRPSAYVTGFVFKTSPFVVVYGGKTGFSLNPAPTNSVSLVSMWSKTGLFSYVHGLSDGRDTPLKDSFLAEKCSWSQNSIYLFCAGDPNLFIGGGELPEAWYKGDVSFRDVLYVVRKEGTSFTSTDLFGLSDDANEDIDLTKPSFDDTSSYFSFINKKDGALWLLDAPRVLGQ